MKPLELVRGYIERARGDDLERAQAAFGHMTIDQLKQQWGQSGRTCGEILADYQQDRRDWQAAKDWFEALVRDAAPQSHARDDFGRSCPACGKRCTPLDKRGFHVYCPEHGNQQAKEFRREEKS